MLLKKYKPSGILKKYVLYYCVMESDEKVDFFPKRRIYSYGCIDLVFHYQQPSGFQARKGKYEIEPRTVICGQQTGYYDLALAGNTGMIFVVFRPCGAGFFFNFPVCEITDQNIALECLIKNEAREIEDKIQNAGCTKKRIAIIEDFLTNRLTCDKNNYTQINYV